MSESNKVIIDKKETQTYTLRGEYGLWAKINLEYGPTSVNVMISSDYGSYDYWWGATGSNPKAFLTRIDMYYTMKKLMGGYDATQEPDHESTIRSIKKKIIEVRREYQKDLSKDDAREAWNDMIGYVNDYGTGEIYYKSMIEHDSFEAIFCDTEAIPFETKLKGQAKDFWEKIWTPFTDELKKELEAENNG